MSSEIAALEVDVKEYKKQLATVASALKDDAGNEDLIDLKNELDEAISVTQSAIDDLTSALALAKPTPAPEPVVEKWSKENHPAFQAGYRRPGAPSSPVVEEPTVALLQVNDTVLAKWVTGDKAFYPARITSITGSSADPVYIVTFKSYGNSETVRGGDIKHINADSRKRKADDSPAASVPFQTSHGAGVISAAANINKDLTVPRKEPSLVSDGPPKPAKIAKKIKANKELEVGKSKWQDFTAKGSKGKLGKTAKPKESMFRTGESATARVGFTGSGQAMRKDVVRTRHVYEQPDEDEY